MWPQVGRSCRRLTDVTGNRRVTPDRHDRAATAGAAGITLPDRQVTRCASGSPGGRPKPWTRCSGYGPSGQPREAVQRRELGLIEPAQGAWALMAELHGSDRCPHQP